MPIRPLLSSSSEVFIQEEETLDLGRDKSFIESKLLVASLNSVATVDLSVIKMFLRNSSSI